MDDLGLDLRYQDNELIPASNGAALYHEVHGEQGPVILTINNFFLIAPLWRTFAGELAKENRVVSWDLRGQGASKAPPGPLSWDDVLDDVERVLDQVGAEQAYLLGSSSSCLIARDFAIRRPDRVRGCVMQGPAFSPYGPVQRQLITRAWMQTLESHGTEGLWLHLYGHAYAGGTQEAMGMAGYLGLRNVFTESHQRERLEPLMSLFLEPEDGAEKLQEMTCPVLLSIGDADFMWSQSQAEDTIAALQNGTLDIIPRAGHVATMENPQHFQESIQRFVSKVEADGTH